MFKLKAMLSESRDIIIRQLEHKYRDYINQLLLQKSCILIRIQHQFDAKLHAIEQAMHHQIPVNKIDISIIPPAISIPLSMTPNIIDNVDQGEHIMPSNNGSNNQKQINLNNKCDQIESATNTKNHERNKPFKCTKCDKTFRRIEYLKRHVKVHVEQKLFKCDQCTKQYTTKKGLEYHLLVHTGERSFKCEICNKTYKSIGSLRRHFKIHKRGSVKNKPFECYQCFKRYSSKITLRYHLMDHFGDRPYKCQICNRGFRCTTGLKNHLTSHSDERAFKCSYCDKSYKYKGGLAKHMKRHLVWEPRKATK